MAAQNSHAEGSGVARYPIVLAHGFFGFDAMNLGLGRFEYFRGVRTKLESLGHSVHVARVSPLAGVKTRACQFARQVEAIDAPRVNVIAHSMGGLDARYAIAHLGLEGKIATLTTVGTPHRGTPVADRLLRPTEWRWLSRLSERFGLGLRELSDLSTERMQEFNDDVRDASTVRYSSVVGALHEGDPGLCPLLAPYRELLRHVGLHDGFVPADSQQWGSVMRQVSADHLAQIGWSLSRRFEAPGFYAGLVGNLAAAGY